MIGFPLLWGILFGAGLAVEAVAIVRKARGDTLSEQVWLLRTRRWSRAIALPAWGWLTWHFWLEPRSLAPSSGVWLDDWAILIVLFVVAVTFNLYGKESDNE